MVRYSLLVVLFLVGAERVDAASPLMVSLQKTYQDVSDLEAEFVQTLQFADFDIPAISKGTLFIKWSSHESQGRKRGMMRWRYREPDLSEVFMDEGTLWRYTPQHRQAIKSKIGEETVSAIAYRLLSGMQEMEKDFEITQKGALQLRLVPHLNIGWTHIDILATPWGGQKEGHRIRSVILYEANKNVTRFDFDAVRINIGLRETFFRFIPPQGVDVLQQP